MLSKNITFFAVLNVIKASIYNLENASLVFDFFKEKYHKVYKNPTLEHRAKENFLSNLNKVNSLNENNRGSEKMYILNKHADIDENDFEERYGLKLTPYDASTVHRDFPLRTDGLRNRIESTPEAQSVEKIPLYDLDDADNLYKQYMKKFNKVNATKSYDRTVHYYRFIKTLVDINKNHYKEKGKWKLGSYADVVRHPYDYIY